MEKRIEKKAALSICFKFFSPFSTISISQLMLSGTKKVRKVVDLARELQAMVYSQFYLFPLLMQLITFRSIFPNISLGFARPFCFLHHSGPRIATAIARFIFVRNLHVDPRNLIFASGITPLLLLSFDLANSYNASKYLLFFNSHDLLRISIIIIDESLWPQSINILYKQVAFFAYAIYFERM